MWQIRIWSQNQHTGKKKKKESGTWKTKVPEKRRAWRVLRRCSSPCSWVRVHTLMTQQAAGFPLHASVWHCLVRHAGQQEQVFSSAQRPSAFHPCCLHFLECSPSDLRWPAPPPSSLLALFSREVMSDSCDPMDCSPPGSSVCEIWQARVLEWVAVSIFQFKHHLLRDTCPDPLCKVVTLPSVVSFSGLYLFDYLMAPTGFLITLTH